VIDVRARLFPLALVLALCGCAGDMGPIRPGPSLPASEAATIIITPPVTTFDGSYRNTIRVVSSFGQGRDVSGWCTSPGQRVITVANGQFTYEVPHPDVKLTSVPSFTAAVAPDGSFYGAQNEGTLSGRITGTHIEGLIDGSACVYTFSGNRA
jgi:hypothetical protein